MCCVLVGLPARGKTYIARKIARYFNWLGVGCQVFNVGTYRRKMFGAEQPHSFFDPDNQEAEQQRHLAALACLQDMLAWLNDRQSEGQNQVAVYDATNSTKKRRQMVCEECKKQAVSIIFIESVCNDERVIKENVRMVKTNSPDYASTREDAGKAIDDFLERITHYTKVYEGFEESLSNVQSIEYPIVRLIDLGQKYEIYGLDKGGGLCRKARLTHFLINLQPRHKTIFLCRHGESEFNLEGRIGGDAGLSESGWKFAKMLPEWFKSTIIDTKVDIWTSSLKRTKQTALYFASDVQRVEWKALDEIDAGVCDALTYKEIEKKYPKDFAARDLDKFKYRYRRGESYADLINRLEPIVMELERRPDPVLIIAHQAVLRAILGYYMESKHKDIPYINVPLHTIIQVEPTAYGCELKEHKSNVSTVDTRTPELTSTTTTLPFIPSFPLVYDQVDGALEIVDQ